MRRFLPPVLLVGIALTGCNRGPTVVVVQPTSAADTSNSPPPVVQSVAAPPIPAPDLSPQERYDAAIQVAVANLSDHKYADALTALEQAKRIQDGEQVRREIARVKLRLDAASAADRAARDIQTVLNDGKADEAARLAAAAVREFGDSDSADAIIRLKRQADAFVMLNLDNPGRAARFRPEGDEALRAKSLRAAAIAYEQAMAAGDPSVRGKLAELQVTLSRYDHARRQAADLRRDPAQLADAVAALRAAAQAWDTRQVREEIADCELAMQCRRERLAVAEFETRGDMGAPLFGRTVAEELLPSFKGRFDLVERNQMARVLDDLRLQAADVIDQDAGRRELARLSKVRYLVVGSVVRLDGVTAHARLLDLQTGLVVQTAKLTAPTPESLIPLLPQLATMLQLSDDQRLAYEQQLARHAAAIPVAAEVTTIAPYTDATSPTPTPVFGDDEPRKPPVVRPISGPIFVSSVRPPDLGGVVIEDFRQLPPPGQASVGIQLALTADHKVRARAVSVAVELGDDLFRRGRYKEAHAQFEVALGLSPGQGVIVARIDRCKQHLSPPVVAPLVPIVVTPRLAVLDFVAAGDPSLVSSGLGAWAAENVSPYLSPPYDLADRGEVYWYMGRLGITLKDAVCDPLARLYLGRALNVRYVVLGTLRATPAGLEAVAHLLDTETGIEVNTAAATARDRGELKCRLGEMARWLLLDPAERLRREAEAAQTAALLAQADAAARQSNFTLAIELTTKAGHRTPGIRVDLLLSQYNRDAERAALEAQRRAAWEQQQALSADAARRQQELCAAAEAARLAGAKQAIAVTAGERQMQREKACQQLVAQANAARDAQEFTIAAQLYESALTINRRAGVQGDLEKVRARAEEQARARAAVDDAVRDSARRQERAVEMARVQAQLDADRRQRAAAEQTRRQAQEQADAREYARLLNEARQFQAKGLWDPAIRALQAAKRLRPTDEVDRMLTAVVTEQSRITRQQGDAARRDAEAKQASETARQQAEADTKRQADLRARADAEARSKAEADAKARAEADAKSRTDADMKRQADLRAADAKARADVEAKRQADLRMTADAKARAEAEARRQAEARANAELQARQKAEADAKAQADAAARFAAETAGRDAEARRIDTQKRDSFNRFMNQGKAALAARHYEEAKMAFSDALRFEPNDPEATQLLKQAQDGGKAPPPPPPPPPPLYRPPPPPATATVAQAFSQQMQAGAAWEKQEKFADALKAYQAALRLAPGDAAATKRAGFAQHMDAGLTALKAGKKPDAAREFEAALRDAPNDPTATKWLQQARR
jgi:colicin import membrane protein